MRSTAEYLLLLVATESGDDGYLQITGNTMRKINFYFSMILPLQLPTLWNFRLSRIQGLLLLWARFLPGFYEAEKAKSKPQEKTGKIDRIFDSTEKSYFLMDLKSLESQVHESFRYKGVEAFLDLFEYSEVRFRQR